MDLSKSKWLTFGRGFDAGLFVACVLLQARRERVSPHSDGNPPFEVPSPSFCTPHVVLSLSVFSVHLAILSVSPAPPHLLQLQRGPQTPSLSSCSSPSCFCTQPDHTCHLHRTQGPGSFAEEGAFIHRSARPSEPLIPSSLHPVTKEWLGQRGYRAAVVRGSFSSSARQNQHR